MVEFGPQAWAFEEKNPRVIKTDKIQVDKTVGMYILISYYQRWDGLGIAVKTNIPWNHW